VIAQPASPTRPLIAGFAIVAMGVLIALATVLALTLIRPVLLAFAFGGIALLIPTFVMRDPRAYWLFLLVISIPFEIHQHTTKWLADPGVLFDQYGLPASGTLALDFYLTDVVLIAMVLPWLVRLCLRRDRLYFPKIGYIFILYLAWALIVSLIEAESFYLSIFEWCREILYFLSFLYITNNVVTRSQVRAIVLALFLGLAIESGAVITMFYLDIGSETSLFSGLYAYRSQRTKAAQGTLYETTSGADSHIKRSEGTFTHPAHAAYYFEYLMAIVLGQLVTVSRAQNRILLGALFAAGCVGLYLTFSRAGMLGFIGGAIVFFALARWARLISRRTFAGLVFIFAMSAATSAPLLIDFLTSRPETVSKRLELIEGALATYWQRPILGAGLNNSSAVAEGARTRVMTLEGSQVQVTVVHNYYLIVLIEVGLAGFLLFFTFFWQIVVTALRSMRAAETEIKLLLVSIVSALASIAINNLGEPFGGYAIHAMLWLYAGLIIALCRRVHADRALPTPGDRPLGTP
jgi:O-antigen ligase